MSYFLFIDESGHDLDRSPYEVLAGLCVQDRDVWNLIDALGKEEERVFGCRYSRIKDEIKGRKFLKTKVFRHAGQMAAIDDDQRKSLALELIEDGAAVTKPRLTALAQAKLVYVKRAFELAAQFHCHAFASIVDRDAPHPSDDVLRRDYAFLFERFFYFLEDRGPEHQGVIVFDELDKAQSKILLGQMERYFMRTQRGRTRSRQIIPAPFFVHSDLTALIQLADLVAYTVSWGFRRATMTRPARPELSDFAKQVALLRYRCTREHQGNKNFKIWSFAVINDLRPKPQRSPVIAQERVGGAGGKKEKAMKR